MSEIHIPFTHGQSEAVDAKLLPQGLFVKAQNVRYQKDAKLGVRVAYRNDSAVSNPVAATLGAATYGRKSDVYILPRTTPLVPATYTQYANGAALNSASRTQSFMAYCPGDLGVFEVEYTDLPLTGSVRLSAVDSITISSTVTAVAYCAYNIVSKASVSVTTGGAFNVLKLLDSATGQAKVYTFAATATFSTDNIKLAINNGVLCMFYAASGADQIRFTSFNTTSAAVITNDVLVAATSAGRSFYFDIAPGASSTETYLVYQSGANTLTFGTVSSVGVFSSLNTIATAAAEARPSISATGLAPTDQVVIVWNDGATFITGNARYTVYRRSSSSFIVATTTFYAGGNVTGYPVVGPLTSGGFGTIDWVAAFNTASTATTPRTVTTFTNLGASNAQNDVILASKPFVTVTSSSLSAASIIVTDVDTAASLSGSYYAMQAIAGSQLVQTPEAVFAQLSAQPADVATPRCDPRRRVIVGATANGRDPGMSAALMALPVTLDTTAGVMLYRSEYGGRAERYQPAALNGDLHFSGPVQMVFDGQDMTDAGLSLPEAPTLTQSAAGTIANGTYQVILVWEYYDFKGRRWRSAPSLPTTIVLASGTNRLIVSWSTVPHMTNKVFNSGQGSNTKVRVYRTTLAQPTIFTDAVGAAVSGSVFTVNLDGNDASIATNEVLYTQGERGGLSGLLQNDRPPACRYLWAGSDRLIAGGLEDPSGVQFSKLRVDGEPMQWANDGGYKANIDTRVSAVAEMDGTWFVCSERGIWTIGGAGPDDNGGGPSFDAPRRLPTDIGCISSRSMLLTGKGLIFQGRPDCFFILPRGGGDPQPIGWEVRDTLTSFPYVAASAFDQQSNVAYWAVTDSTATNGRILVYDTRIGQWYVDNFINRACFSLSIYDSLLHIDGSVIETPGNWQDTDGTTPTTVIPVLEMGDTRPFGISGSGRLRRITLLAELRDTVAVPTISVSYDSGVTYAETVSYTLTGSAGDVKELEHEPVTIRGSNWRIKLSWTAVSASEGIIFNGLSLEVYQAAGLKRLAQTARA